MSVTGAMHKDSWCCFCICFSVKSDLPFATGSLHLRYLQLYKDQGSCLGEPREAAACLARRWVGVRALPGTSHPRPLSWVGVGAETHRFVFLMQDPDWSHPVPPGCRCFITVPVLLNHEGLSQLKIYWKLCPNIYKQKGKLEVWYSHVKAFNLQILWKKHSLCIPVHECSVYCQWVGLFVFIIFNRPLRSSLESCSKAHRWMV